MVALPEWVLTGKVVGTSYVIGVDTSNDVDTDPDVDVVLGEGTLTPSVPYLLYQGTPSKFTAYLNPVPFILTAAGVQTPDGDDLYVVANKNQTDGNPSEFYWQVTLKLNNFGGRIDPFALDVYPGQTADITDQLPVPAALGDATVRGLPTMLAAGAVTTLAPGSPATVNITGEAPYQTIDFGIPQGQKGDKGDPGTGDVTSVNGIEPQVGANGNVVLTSADVSALPDTAKLSDLTDVSATAPADADVLIWDAATSEWVPGAVVLPISIPDVQNFIASGTWTKPAGATRVVAEIISAGAAGGGSQGTGGGGGGYERIEFSASDLASTESVTVGAGGSTVGASGGSSSFAGFSVPGGLGQSGYQRPDGGGGGGQGGNYSSGAPVVPAGSSYYGGGGGGCNNSNAPHGGYSMYGAGGGGGWAGGAGSGGLGGMSGDPGALLGGNGGDSGSPAAAGVAPGGGGGGGSGSFGAGARGQVRITSYFD